MRLQGRLITLIIYMGFNNDTPLKLGRESNINPVKAAICQEVLINTRGIEPVMVKGVFLVEWTLWHLPQLILKSAQCYSGQDMTVGPWSSDSGAAIQDALAHGGYIVQSLVPLEDKQEYYPTVDADASKILIALCQTDFRCFSTDQGLIGFLSRFWGIPTNVASGGGGTQSFSLLKSSHLLQEVNDLFNRALSKLPCRLYLEIKEEVHCLSLDLGFTYLPGLISTSLKLRCLTGSILPTLSTMPLTSGGILRL